MKKIALLAAVLILAAGCKGKKSEAVTPTVGDVEPVATEEFAAEEEEDASEGKWRKLRLSNLEMNPVEAFATDWMALSVGNAREFNSMTISWGSIGQLWGKPVVTVYVSSDRYTKKLMDKAEYFTLTAFPKSRKCKDALVYLGSHSGRDEKDKAARAGLTAEFTALGNPVFAEGCMALECRIIYKEEFRRDLLPSDVKPMYDDMGLHTFYIGEIVASYRK